jgi:hypothetical protein
MKIIALIAISTVILNTVLSQPVYIDRPVQAGELLLFPDVADSTQYYYLPNKLSLGVTSSGKPQFSFLRYVQNVVSVPGDLNRTEGEGGGILHALVELKITDEQFSAAQAALRQKTEQEEAVIVGPIIYKGGNFALVSNFAEEGSEFTKKVVGVGRAPVFVGNKAAVSIRLTKLGAKILWESCQSLTPDLSFSFIMDFTGYRSPMKAHIEVDWDKVYDHKAFNIGVGVGVPAKISIGTEIKAAFEELRETGAIKVTSFGADEKMETLIESAYTKILGMMFQPFSMPKSQADETKTESIYEQIASALNIYGKGANQSVKRAFAPLSINVGYEQKQQRKTGKFLIDLSKATTETVNFRFDENLGSSVSECKECFRSLNLDDPFYKQREIFISVDGLNSEQFNKYINFATVSMRKLHGGGELSTSEVRIGQKAFAETIGEPYKMVYGWKDGKDAKRENWLQYEYRTTWSFYGNYNVTDDWKKTDQLGINIAPPFHPIEVEVSADADTMQKAGLRLVTVKFYYDFGTGEKIEQVNIKSSDKIISRKVDFMLRPGTSNYEYEIVWRLAGNKILTSGRRKTNDTIIYVDNITSDALVIPN